MNNISKYVKDWFARADEDLNLTEKGSIPVLVIGITIGLIILMGIGGIIYWRKMNSLEKLKYQLENLPEATSEFACALEPKNNYTIISGTIKFPRGIKNSDAYKVAIDLEEYPIFQNGKFCAYSPNGEVKILSAASSKDEDNFVLLYVITPKRNKDIIVNADSTAIGMIFVSPFFLHADPEKAEEIIGNIESNQKVKALVKEIENKEILSADDIETGSVNRSFVDALNSLLSDNENKKEKTPLNDNSLETNIVRFEMTIEPVNYRQSESGNYVNGRVVKLDEKAQSKFKEDFLTKSFGVGSQVGVYFTDNTKISGKQFSEGYNNLKADIKGYLDKTALEALLEGKNKGGTFFADEIIVY